MQYGSGAAKQEVLNEVTGRRDQLPPPVLTGVPRPGIYADPDAVKQAYHDGKLTKDQAAAMLRDKFGYH